MSFEIHSEAELEAVAVAVIAGGRARSRLRRSLDVGHDPLANALARLRDPETRRRSGAIYTPIAVVESMVHEAATLIDPVQVVDPGAGTARFLIAAGRAFPAAELIGVEIDPLAAQCARANLAAAGLGSRSRIEVCDFRRVELPGSGPRLFAGNPPYVRHHQIDAADKLWLSERAAALGVRCSGLAGLHIHFIAAIAAMSEPGDAGVLITSAEWLDAGYGHTARELFAGRLGLVDLAVFDADAPVFTDAMTTACVTSFAVGRGRPVTARRVRCAADLVKRSGRCVDRAELDNPRWSGLPEDPVVPELGAVELGVSFRVHRGQATGANSVWIAGDDTPPLPARFCVPAITRASELFAAGPVLDSVEHLRHVIALPADLDELEANEREQVDAFLEWARERGADQSYLARHRKPWWSVKLKAPAPILATYMARRPPAFVRNIAGARHLNIAHGIYPSEPCSDEILDGLARALRAQTTTADGRTYAGGLIKFEPRDMERLMVPAIDTLAAAYLDTVPDTGAAGTLSFSRPTSDTPVS